MDLNPEKETFTAIVFSSSEIELLKNILSVTLESYNDDIAFIGIINNLPPETNKHPMSKYMKAQGILTKLNN
jgi:hypothetical protein